MPLNLGLFDISLKLGSGFSGYEAYAFYLNIPGSTQHQSVCSITSMQEEYDEKKCSFARGRSMYVYALDGSKKIMSILNIEV